MLILGMLKNWIVCHAIIRNWDWANKPDNKNPKVCRAYSLDVANFIYINCVIGSVNGVTEEERNAEKV